MSKKRSKEWFDEFAKGRIEAAKKEGVPLTKQQVAQGLADDGYEIEGEFTLSEFGENLGRGLLDYGDAFSPVSLSDGSPQVPPIITEGVPTLAKTALGGLGYLWPWHRFRYQDYPDQVVKGVGEFVKHPIRTTYYNPVEVLTTAAPGVGQVAGALGKGSALTKVAQASKWAAPLDELSSMAMQGLGSKARSGVKNWRQKKKGQFTGQIDPEMIAFQQEAIERGVVDPVNLETGEGGFPAAIVSQDPGARRVTKNIAQKGGDNAVFREINQVKDAIDAEESFFVNSFDASNPVEAINSARQGLDRLDKNYEVMKARFKELGLDEMETEIGRAHV